MVMEENTEKQTVARESGIPLKRIGELGPGKSGEIIIYKAERFYWIAVYHCVKERLSDFPPFLFHGFLVRAGRTPAAGKDGDPGTLLLWLGKLGVAVRENEEVITVLAIFN